MKESSSPETKTLYVAGFMFSPDFENVVLIEKEKPEWQKGKYNAIGGKIEVGESPSEAMAREFEEEAFIQTQKEDWLPLCVIGNDKYSVYFFFCSNENWRDHLTRETEEVFHIPVMDLHTVRHKLINNLNWLIPLCLDRAENYSGSIRTNEPFDQSLPRVEAGENKPDWQSIYKDYFLQGHDGLHDHWEKESAKKIFDKLVLPLSSELNTLKTELDEVKKERDELLDTVKKFY